MTVKRNENTASVWINNGPIDQELCSKYKDLLNYGLFRKLNDGHYEFITYCNPEVKKFISIHETDLQKILDSNVPAE